MQIIKIISISTQIPEHNVCRIFVASIIVYCMHGRTDTWAREFVAWARKNTFSFAICASIRWRWISARPSTTLNSATTRHWASSPGFPLSPAAINYILPIEKITYVNCITALAEDHIIGYYVYQSNTETDTYQGPFAYYISELTYPRKNTPINTSIFEHACSRLLLFVKRVIELLNTSSLKCRPSPHTRIH